MCISRVMPPYDYFKHQATARSREIPEKGEEGKSSEGIDIFMEMSKVRTLRKFLLPRELVCRSFEQIFCLDIIYSVRFIRPVNFRSRFSFSRSDFTLLQ
jgi:hypothetical protein